MSRRNRQFTLSRFSAASLFEDNSKVKTGTRTPANANAPLPPLPLPPPFGLFGETPVLPRTSPLCPARRENSRHLFVFPAFGGERAVAASCVLHPVVSAARLERRREDETESTRANEKECSPIIVVVVVVAFLSFYGKSLLLPHKHTKRSFGVFLFQLKSLLLQTTSCYSKHHVFFGSVDFDEIKRIFGYFASHPREKKAQLSRARDARVVAVVVVVDDDDDDWTTTTTTRSATSTGIRTRASVVQHRRRQPKGRTTDYSSSHHRHPSPERRNFLGDASMR